MTRRSVIVLGYGAEEQLEECLAALAGQLGTEDELILVDNGVVGIEGRRDRLAAHATIITPQGNTGFSGGCNVGAARARGEVLVFCNSDAVVEPGALDELVGPLADMRLGIASGCLLLADRPDRVNSVGNPISYIGITWAGSLGERWEDHAEVTEVTCATGGFFAIRREVWDELGGFDDVYFAYHEDTDLSLRARLRGYRIDYIPTARATHHYEFSRNPRKMYLLERNRLLVVLTDFPAAVRRRALPMVVATEPLFWVLSVAQGWWRQKAHATWWVLTHRDEIRRLRRKAEAGSNLAPSRFADLLVDRIDAQGDVVPRGMGLVNLVLAGYWRLARPRGRRTR